MNGHGLAGLSAALDFILETGVEEIHNKEIALMRRFYNGVKDIKGVRVYGDLSQDKRCAIIALNIWDYDSGAVADAVLEFARLLSGGGQISSVRCSLTARVAIHCESGSRV